MARNSLSKVGGTFSILLGVSYIVVGVTFLLQPEAQRAGAGEFEDFISSFGGSPTLLTIQLWAFVIGALLALGVVPAVFQLVRSEGEGWIRWASNLAYLGFSVTALGILRILTLLPIEASAFADADNQAKAMITGDNIHLALDPNGWLQFGAIGIWVLVVSLAALSTNRLPKTWAYLGIATAILYWVVVVGNVLEIPLLNAIAAGLGGIVLAPIWYIWIGVRLRRPAVQPQQDVVG